MMMQSLVPYEPSDCYMTFIKVESNFRQQQPTKGHIHRSAGIISESGKEYRDQNMLYGWLRMYISNYLSYDKFMENLKSGEFSPANKVLHQFLIDMTENMVKIYKIPQDFIRNFDNHIFEFINIQSSDDIQHPRCLLYIMEILYWIVYVFDEHCIKQRYCDGCDFHSSDYFFQLTIVHFYKINFKVNNLFLPRHLRFNQYSFMNNLALFVQNMLKMFSEFKECRYDHSWLRNKELILMDDITGGCFTHLYHNLMTPGSSYKNALSRSSITETSTEATDVISTVSSSSTAAIPTTVPRAPIAVLSNSATGTISSYELMKTKAETRDSCNLYKPSHMMTVVGKVSKKTSSVKKRTSDSEKSESKRPKPNEE
jgi:hypothetical protein